LVQNTLFLYCLFLFTGNQPICDSTTGDPLYESIDNLADNQKNRW